MTVETFIDNRYPNNKGKAHDIKMALIGRGIKLRSKVMKLRIPTVYEIARIIKVDGPELMKEITDTQTTNA